MRTTNATRRKMFKWVGVLGFLGFGGLIEPTGYFFFTFFSFFIYANKCITPDVEDEMYQQNFLKACKITAKIGMIFCILMINTFLRTNDIYIIKLLFTIGAVIIWTSQPISLYYYEKKR